MKVKNISSFHFTGILFAFTIFIGSFLLFQVQPIIGKYILPWFGGTSAVWTTSLLFFQLLLLAGYFYVFLISRLAIKTQVILHSLLLLGITVLVFFLFSLQPAPILPDIRWKPAESYSPIIQVLGILTISIGLPYFLLSTTSVLLQKWFSFVYPGKSPYLLYSLSNTASLLAVISYPLIIEPFLRLQAQGIWWSLAFILYGTVFLFSCGVTFFSSSKPYALPAKKADASHESHIAKRSYGFWLLLPGISSVMLLSITNLLTQSVAPIPFLWMLPLCLYLLSFILSFSGGNWCNIYAYVFIFTTPVALAFSIIGAPSVLLGILVYSLSLFSCCMLCHGEVYHRKPAPKQLDLFYLFISLGSAVGALLVSIIAPLFFKGVWEVYIGYYFGFILAVYTLLQYNNSFLSRSARYFFTSTREAYIAAALLFPFATGAFFLFSVLTMNSGSITLWRNFYAALKVEKKVVDNKQVAYFNHGNILHGMQYLSGPERYEPTTYFHKKSGIGLLLTNYPRPENGIRVGIIGLGVGTMATYGQKSDFFRFYEINPDVVTIANNDFTYLKDSKAQIDVVLGDGRLSILKELTDKSAEKYDILVMDAFSDDAIPVHLLTREAFELYLQRIEQPDGIIAVHITNSYLDIKPVLVASAKHFGLQLVFIHNPGNGDDLRTDWAILAKNDLFLKTPIITAALNKKPVKKQVRLWTDDYSNLLQIVK